MQSKRFFQLALASLFVLFALAPIAGAEPITFAVDPSHSSVAFKVRHFFTQVPGHFREFTGTIVYDPQDVTKSSVEMTVQAASIDTANENRDGHLRSADFFDVENHPTLSFKSTSVAAGAANSLQVTGDFMLHGVTKRMTIQVDVLGMMKGERGSRAGFASSFTIDRKEFGVVWNRNLDQGGTILGDDVTISIDVEAVEPKQEG